jgi:hypothetical protein
VSSSSTVTSRHNPPSQTAERDLRHREPAEALARLTDDRIVDGEKIGQRFVGDVQSKRDRERQPRPSESGSGPHGTQATIVQPVYA